MSTIKSSSEDLTLDADGGSSEIKLKINNVEKASISSAGAFTSTTIDATVLTGNLPSISGASLTNLPSQAHTGNVAFPATQVASADANTLDDYEEGTFTPILTAASGNDHVHSTKVGFYTKVGNIVTVACHWVHYGGGTSSGDVTIFGLPFTSKNISHHTSVFNWGYCTQAAFTAGYHFSGYLEPNRNWLTMKTWDATGGVTTTQFSEIPSYVTMSFGGTYQTA
jgi:hypothetical protein